jgi:hypothetical protein
MWQMVLPPSDRCHRATNPTKTFFNVLHFATSIFTITTPPYNMRSWTVRVNIVSVWVELTL